MDFTAYMYYEVCNCRDVTKFELMEVARPFLLRLGNEARYALSQHGRHFSGFSLPYQQIRSSCSTQPIGRKVDRELVNTIALALGFIIL